MKEKLSDFYNTVSGTLIIRLLASWAFSAVFMSVFASTPYSDLDGYKKISLTLAVSIIIISFVLFTGINRLFRRFNTDCVLLTAFFGLYSFLVALNADSWYTLFGMGALWAVLLYFYLSVGFVFIKKDFGRRRTIMLVCAAALVFIFFVGAVGVLRYLTFSAPNYDFGIFCNMFRNMKVHFSPFTTCERDVRLSHFAIHISPVFYLLLPVYSIFPSGITLQLAQTLLLISGVVPVCLITKKYRLSNFGTVFVAFIYCLSPVLASGTNYDFHENCFLVPLLLWMFYFFEKEKYIPFGVFAGLTLLVKEDAAVYVAFFALYMIFDRKKVLAGSITAGGALLYFVIAVALLSKFGNGAMTGRYSNYIAGNGGLIEMVKTVIANPAYVLSQLFISKNHTYADKLLFILQMLAPLGFLPFTAKKPSRLLLLLPMVLINLMTLYVYQYSIGYQYAFGSFTFLFYLSIINLSEMKPLAARTVVDTAAVITAMCFIFAVIPRFSHYTSLYKSNSEEYAAMTEMLREVPTDKSVVCSTFLLPHLADRDEVYELEYHDAEKNGLPDYVVLDMRYNTQKYYDLYTGLGYIAVQKLEVNGKTLITVLEQK